jgi:hypothetical protein
MTKTKEPLSTCCDAPLIASSEYHTHYYVCSKCGKECSAVARINGKEAMLSREQEKEMKGILNKAYGKEVYPQEEEGKKEIDCFVIFNCEDEFCEAYSLRNETSAKVLVEVLDENWGKKGAYYKKGKIIIYGK